jgi:hypothetical protein
MLPRAIDHTTHMATHAHNTHHMHTMESGVVETTHARTPPSRRHLMRRTWDKVGSCRGPEPGRVAGLVKNETQ